MPESVEHQVFAIAPDILHVDELTREFLIESQEGLDRMERCLTELEARPGDAELLSDIFRCVHTIKGTTGFFGFSRLESLAHNGENLLGLLREGRLIANGETITALLSLLDGLRSILRSIESAGTDGAGSDEELIARLRSLQEAGSTEAHGLPNYRAESAHVEPRSPEQIPEQIRDKSPQQQIAKSAPPDAPAPASALPASAADSTLRVDIDLLNRMMNLVGELVLTRNQILQTTSQDTGFAALSRRLDMVTADLREAVMKARMQPVSQVFSKFPRVVRDLAQGLDKRVRLQMEGQETELDKSLLEAIKDPLTHAVRNAVDHGFEKPEVRAAAGKNPEGLLRLRAAQEGSHVLIEVIDDGIGLRTERIREKAIERQLITAEKAARLTSHELMQLVFLPGFSTAAAVTNISGRGVGMDVVRTNVEKIGGKVELESRPGIGTTLRLRIPLTLAIIPALIVRSGSQSFALPQNALSELVHVPSKNIATAIEWMEGTPLYRLRGRLLPLVFLDALLGMRSPGREPENGCFIAVLNADGRHFGLILDGLEDPEEIVVKPLSAALKAVGLYSGATVLGNGGLALILDPGALALQAGVGVAIEGHAEVPAETVQDNRKAEYLLVDAGPRRAAVPLDEVLRIDRVPRSRIECGSAADAPVLQFEASILPLQDPAGVLATADEPVTIVVCNNRGRHVGIVVSQVLDVAGGEPLLEAGSQSVAAGLVLLKEQVTSVVDLNRTSPLPAAHAAGCDLDWPDTIAEPACLSETTL